MIPLRLKIEALGMTDPFVVRLRSTTPNKSASDKAISLGEGIDAFLTIRTDEAAEYVSDYGRLRILNTDPSDVDGDVLLVNPSRDVAHRLIRAKSKHNTFLVTERCDQLCKMCSQPPKPNHIDLFPQLKAAALLAPLGATIGLSGGEPTLYKKQLMSFLKAVICARPDLQFHVLTNAQHFTEQDTSILRSFPAGKIVWGIPIYSAMAEDHDIIVGKEGAYERLLHSLALLCRAGATVELRTVVMNSNTPRLPSLAHFVSTHLRFVATWAIMQLENIGFARRNWNNLFHDTSIDFLTIATAVDIARARGVNTLLYNFPLCTVPASYRAFAPSTISDWKRRFLSECEGCSLKDRCGGFFEWYPEKNGFKMVGLS